MNGRKHTNENLESPNSSPKKLSRKQMTDKAPKATPSRNPVARRPNNKPSGSSSPTAHGAKTSLFASTNDEDDSVKVIVRIRPLNERELAVCGTSPNNTSSNKSCLTLRDSRTVVLEDSTKIGEYAAQYDHAMGEETSQEDMFSTVGQSVVEHCMAGFNSSIFCYGQTGAGKTHTMVGDASRDAEGRLSPSCGLVPRVFEALFNSISQKEQDHPLQSLRYSVKCSFLEIYNEEITDLLSTGSSGLQIRDGDIKKGLYVQGLSETEVVNADDVLGLIDRGSASRHMAATKMNERSSRSHSVFTATIEAHERTETGLTNIRYAKLNLIDLAGSERTGKSGVTGERMAEAKSINRSLTVLGRVITALVERQKKPATHVPYRDSRLTFLLQESLGGNSKTCIVANVSPAQDSAQETYSTLVFAANAKSIKNRAVVNEDVMGDMKALQLENSRLQRIIAELQEAQRLGTAAEVEVLKQQLDQVQGLFDQNNALINELRAEHGVLKKDLNETKVANSRLADEAVQLRFDNENLSSENERLREEQACIRGDLEEEIKQWKAEMKEVKDTAAAEVQKVTKELQELKDCHAAASGQLEESRAEVRRVQKEAREEAAIAAAKTADLQRETETLRSRVAELEADAETLRAKISSEHNNVAKYKRMVGEIGRLIDWAQAASPLSASNGTNSPSPGLISAFRDPAMRASLSSAAKQKQPLALAALTPGSLPRCSPLGSAAAVTAGGNIASMMKNIVASAAADITAAPGENSTENVVGNGSNSAVKQQQGNKNAAVGVVVAEGVAVAAALEKMASPAKKGVTTRRTRGAKRGA